MPDTPSRRDVLQSAGLGAAILTTGVAGSARGFAANETIHLGVIGCGGRAARNLMPKAMKQPGVKVVALCDVFDGNLGRAKATVEKAGGNPFTTKRHEELLARKDVDAVIVGTPDHWHVPVTVDACAAGKDVYCEKPLTHDLSEGEKVIAAQNEHKCVVQVGTQQRSMPQWAKARKLVQAGKIGHVHKVHMSWNRNFIPFRKYVPNINPNQFDWKRFLGNAPDQPFDPYRALGNWRWFWDFGAGILGDLMVHWMDAVNWVLDLPAPSHAVTVGDQFATKGVWETPDTIQTLLQYPKQKLQVHFEGTFVNRHRKAGTTFMGTKGTLYVDRGRYELHPEPRSDFKPEVFSPGGGEKGADFDVDGTSLHIADWLDCIRTRRKPIAPAEAGVAAAAAAHIANAALRGKA